MYRGAGILFYRTGGGGTEILLFKRAIRPQRGAWSVVGGAFSPSKDGDLLDCAKREALEEAFVGHPSDELSNGCFEIVPERCCSLRIPLVFRYDTFLVEVKTAPPGWPSINWESSAFAWFPIEKLPDKTHLGVRVALRQFRRWFGSGDETRARDCGSLR